MIKRLANVEEKRRRVSGSHVASDDQVRRQRWTETMRAADWPHDRIRSQG